MATRNEVSEAEKIIALACALKEKGLAPDSKAAYEMALSMLEKKGQANNSGKPENTVFLNEDSVGADFKGKSLKDLMKDLE